MSKGALMIAFGSLAGCNLDSSLVPVDGTPDALLDVSPACDPAKPFNTPVNLGAGVNSDLLEFGARLSADQLTIYFSASDAVNDSHIAASTRPNVNEVFGPRVLIDELSSPSGISERDPSITEDGLTIYFASTRVAGGVSNDLHVATRQTLVAEFGMPAPVQMINSANNDLGVTVMPDGKTLYFSSDRLAPGVTSGVFRSTRAAGGMFEMPVHLDEIGDAVEPAVTPDELTIYFSRNEDIFVARRATSTSSFSLPIAVPELNTADRERPSWISPDGCTLVFDSDRSGGVGGFDVYMATRML